MRFFVHAKFQRQPEIQCSEDGSYSWAEETSSLEMVRSEETFILQSYHSVENKLILVLHFDRLRGSSSEIIQNNVP